MSTPSLETVLVALSTPDDAQRRSAEAALNRMKEADPGTLTVNLLSCLRKSDDPLCRTFAAVLLRQMLHRTSPVWKSLPADRQALVKRLLLEVFGTEAVGHIRRKACHTTAELASTVLRGGAAWPELMPFVMQACQQPSVELRVTALTLLRRVIDYTGRAEGGRSFAIAHARDIAGLATVCLGDANLTVRVRAAQVAVALIRNVKKKDRAAFDALMPKLMETLQAVLNSDEGSANDLLQSLTELCLGSPEFLRKFIPVTFAAMLAVAKHGTFSPRTRLAAMEFMLSLCEAAPDMMRKHVDCLKQLMACACSFMTIVKDDPQWANKFDRFEAHHISGTAAGAGGGDDDDDGSNTDTLNAIGSETCDRLCRALGGRVMAPLVLEAITPMLSSPDWRVRQGGPMALGLAAEGCNAFLLPHIPQVLRMVVTMLNDADLRVRNSALYCAGEMALHLGRLTRGAKDFFVAVHRELVPALVDAMSAKHNHVKRLRAVAASALALYCQSNRCKAKYLGDHKALFAVVHDLFVTGGKPCLPNAFALLGSAASVLGTAFSEVSGPFLDIAKTVLAAPVDPAYRIVHCKAIECFGVMMNNLTPELAAAHADEAMRTLVGILARGFADDDVGTYRSLMMGVARVAESMGAGFSKYVSAVTLPILGTATRDVGAETTELSDSDDDGGDDDDPNSSLVYVPELGRCKITIDNNALQDKQHACKAIFDFLSSVGPTMLPVLDDVTAGMASVCHYQNSVMVRQSALCSLPIAVKLAVGNAADPAHGQRVLNMALPAVMKSLLESSSHDELVTAAEALDDIMGTCAKSGPKGAPRAAPPLASLPDMFAAVRTVYEAAMKRRLEAAAAAKDNEDFDEDDALEFRGAEESEDDLLTCVTDAVASTLKIYGAAVLPALNASLLPYLTSACLPNKANAPFRGVALCLMLDVMEHGSPDGLAVAPVLLPHIVECMHSKEQVLLQAAAYGIGVYARFAGDMFTPHLVGATKLLVAVASNPEKLEDAGMQMCADNAVASLVRVMQSRAPDLSKAGVDVSKDVLSPVLQALPLQADAVEGQFVHAWLVDNLKPGGMLQPVLPRPTVVGLLCTMLGSHVQSQEEQDEDMCDEATVGTALLMLKALLMSPEGKAAYQALPPELAELVGELMEAM